MSWLSTNLNTPRVLGPDLKRLRGRSVVLSVQDMAKAAAALIELDGFARRVVLCPAGWEPWRLESAARDAEADALVYDPDADAGSCLRPSLSALPASASGAGFAARC